MTADSKVYFLSGKIEFTEFRDLVEFMHIIYLYQCNMQLLYLKEAQQMVNTQILISGRALNRYNRYNYFKTTKGY
jgi:hypothetical protein